MGVRGKGKEKIKLEKKKQKERELEQGKGRGHVPMLLMSADEHRHPREARDSRKCHT